mgnify:CR=1 FL=1
MIFFELASSAFTAVLYGIVLTVIVVGLLYVNGSLKFEITAKRLYAASQRVL